MSISQRWIVVTILLASSAAADQVDVYFGTQGGLAKGIYRSTFDLVSGDLSPATLAAQIDSPGFLAIDPTQTYLYAVAGDKEPVVAAFRMHDDGALTQLNTVPIGDGGGAHISIHPSGKLLLTAQYGGGSVALFPIKSDGSLAPRAQIVKHDVGSNVVPGRQDSPHPHWVGFSSDGRFAFVADLGMDQIVAYSVDADDLSIIEHARVDGVPGGGPRHMKFSPDERFAYLLNELSLSVSTFSYESETGLLTLKSTKPSLSEESKAAEAFNSGSEILVHPNGRFVYSANRGNDSVSVFNAQLGTGDLMLVEVEPIRGSWPRNINLAPSGNWLLAAGTHSNTVSVFAVDPDSGELQFQTGNVINVPGAICIVFREPPAVTRVFLLAGQSNMDGRGDGSKLTVEDRRRLEAVQDRVFLAYNGLAPRPLDVTTPQAQIARKFGLERTFGPELFFGIGMAEAWPDRNILLIKRSLGGTSLYGAWNPHWNIDNASLTNEAEGPQLFKVLIGDIETTLATRDENEYEFAGILWVQGEADSNVKKYGPVPSQSYGDNLAALIRAIRGVIGEENLPFHMLQVGDGAVVEGMRNTANEMNNVFFIPQSTYPESPAYLPEYGPPIGHYNYDGMKRIGNLFAESVLRSHDATTQ